MPLKGIKTAVTLVDIKKDGFAVLQVRRYVFERGLHDTVGGHSFGYFFKACDIRSHHVVSFVAVFFAALSMLW